MSQVTLRPFQTFMILLKGAFPGDTTGLEEMQVCVEKRHSACACETPRR